MIESAAIMTAQKLYTTLKFLSELDQTLGLQKALESIRDTLNSLVSSPANPQYQGALAGAIGSFSSAADGLREAVNPSQWELIGEMGGQEFFDASIAATVKDSIAKNAMTPSVARDFVKDLAARREEFMETVENTAAGLAALHVTELGAKPGQAEVAFLIPREIFDNQLGKLAKELKFISSLVHNFGEAVTGEARPVELQELSSSVPTVVLLAGVVVLDRIAVVVNKFLEAWKKVEEIRELREKLKKLGMKGTALAELTDQISSTVEEVVEDSTTTIIAEYKLDGGRKNELSNALNQDLRRLFGQIERGLTIEFHAGKESDTQNDAQKKELENISTVARQMRFPVVAHEPLLLTNGEVVEGRIQTIKTTTVRRSTKKAKGTQSDSKDGSSSTA